MPRDLRTKGIVLRRTNYGESDRILNFITPEGKISVMAKGVRKEKSKLAGGIELFSVADIVVHFRRDTAADSSKNFGILTGAKMLKFYQGIINDLPRLELASQFLKQIDRAAEMTDSPEYFEILWQSLAALNARVDAQIIRTWFNLNLARIKGEEINLLADVAGAPLSPNRSYTWNDQEEALYEDIDGTIGAKEIKLARLMLSTNLSTVARVEGVAVLTSKLVRIGEQYAQK